MEIYIIIGILIFTGIIVLLVVVSRFRKKLNRREKKYYRTKWQEIQKETDYRHAVMSADKLLEKLLQRKGYQGSLGQMLVKSRKEYSDLNGLWFAHKIRNRLAHEIDFKLSNYDAQKALNFFAKAFSDLGVL